MADDLDAFFEEVSHVEAEAKQEEDLQHQQKQEETTQEDDRPTKKQKRSVEPPIIPRGIVVAAASTVRLEPPSDGPATTATAPKGQPQATTHAETPATVPSVPPIDRSYMVRNGMQASAADSNATTAAGAPATSDAVAGISTAGSFTIFVGNLGAEVTEPDLLAHFAARYPSAGRAQIMRGATGDSKGFGFVTFGQALECARARREMDQTWLGARPIRIKKYHGGGGAGHTQGGAGAHQRQRHPNKKKR